MTTATSKFSDSDLRHALWHFAPDSAQAVQPGSFMTTLMKAISVADLGNRARIEQGFPELVAAFLCVSEVGVAATEAELAAK